MARDRPSRPEAKPQRLFVAVSPPDPVAAVVEAAIEPWRRAFPKARWVPRANWHVTLQFLGATYPRLVPWVRTRLGEAAAGASPFQTRVSGVGAFPSTRRARVLWVGVDDAEGRFAALVEAIQRSLASEFPPEDRAFTPHLTVARSDPPLRLPEGFAETTLESEPFTVDTVVLMRSHLRRPAPVYEPLETCRLGGASRED
jgi:2'-5' RNA ligase